ncbi:MAG: glycogen/starch synthase [Ferruginibacter sp.]
MVDINGLLDREKIYGYSDDPERFIAFQIAVVDWLNRWSYKPDIVHVHDYHTALIPFIMQNCFAYNHLADIKTVLTIHNGEYQGWMGWEKANLLPAWNTWQWGKLDWNKTLNPLASGIKCAMKVTTVSRSYMEELRYNSKGLEALFEYEKGKCLGILNGIDNAVWDPLTDSYLNKNFSVENIDEGKSENKKLLCQKFNLDITKPLIIFIGRLVGEKAADLLPQVISDSIYNMRGSINFLILGSGEHYIESHLENMRGEFMGYYNSQIGYNEQLSHEMYAGGDFFINAKQSRTLRIKSNVCNALWNCANSEKHRRLA